MDWFVEAFEKVSYESVILVVCIQQEDLFGISEAIAEDGKVLVDVGFVGRETDYIAQ